VLTIGEYIRTHPAQGFTPGPRYFPAGDFLAVYWSDERCVAETVAPGVHVERSLATGEIVGVKVYGVSRVIQRDTPPAD
jgi:hypothetical protein